MKMIFRNAENYLNGKGDGVFGGSSYGSSSGVFERGDFVFDGKQLKAMCRLGDVSNSEISAVYSNCLILPGFCDVHVHFREPGFCYKEDISSGSRAAAAGGYTDVCTMPNLDPVPDSIENMSIQLEAIMKNAVVRVHPFGALTVGERGLEGSDIEGLADMAVGFSDDGRGVQDGVLMESLMRRVQGVGAVISAHCEDNSLLRGGYIHDGRYAAAHGHRGICSESEWRPIARDIELAKKMGVKYHVCHISTKKSVEIIRRAKSEGVDVTCETAPHYLLLDEGNLCEDGRFKMNPPLRSAEDREALIEGLTDGTIDMIATDHAPHSIEEKSRGLEGSAMGVVGLETAFCELYTHLVRTNVISMERLIELMVYAPRRRFGISNDTGFCVWDVENQRVIDTSLFKSKGRSTPFEGDRVYGQCILTVADGKILHYADK